MYISDIIYSILEVGKSISNCNIDNLLGCICKIRNNDIQINIINDLIEKGIKPDSKEYLCQSLISYFNEMDLITFYRTDNEYVNKMLELLDGNKDLIYAIVNKINLLLKCGYFYYQNDGLNKLENIDSKYKQNIDDKLSVDLLINIINGSYAGAYNCKDIINGKIQDIEIIIDK